MELFNNHRTLFGMATSLFIGLTLLIAIIPAKKIEKNNAPLPNAVTLTNEEIKGKMIYISNGCVACHTQQIRNVGMDKIWGERPSIAADYANTFRTDVWRNTATLMGTERTGPDLTNLGVRMPSRDWNLVHLYNPRIVAKESVMPAYRWMFTLKKETLKEDVIVNVPKEYLPERDVKIVAKKEALHLVAYLLSLKQTSLPDGTASPEFLSQKEEVKKIESVSKAELDGAALYSANCQSCHQQNGEGIKGAFPPLKGSPIVLSENPETLVNIILNGYSGREAEGFAIMPPIGTLNNLSTEEITAIINHERTSWGNDAKTVTAAEINRLIELIKEKQKIQKE